MTTPPSYWVGRALLGASVVLALVAFLAWSDAIDHVLAVVNHNWRWFGHW